MRKIAALLLSLGLVAFNAFADVNINSATQAQLETLKGVGPAKAKAIIDYRTKNGPFKSLEDVEKVNGIGPGIFKNIKSDIKLSGETQVKAQHGKGAEKSAAKKAEPATPAVKAEPAKPAMAASKADPARPSTPPTKAEAAKPATPTPTAPAKPDTKK